jgi:putative transposase
MPDWPHSPLHQLSAVGAFMVTAATYLKAPIFSSRARLDFLQRHLLQLAEEYCAALQAWAIFPNHYHFVADFTDPKKLPVLIRHLHSLTARQVNQLDASTGRRVWFQYWDSRLSFEKSYFARLRYVHENAVHHGLVSIASNYPWCSAGWFEQRAEASFRKTILNFPCDTINVNDAFEVSPDFLTAR